MRNSKWCLVIGLLAVALFVTTASARDAVQRGSSQLDNATDVGVLLNDGGAVAGPGDIVYGGASSSSGYYYRPFPGYRDYDDIHLEAGPRGDLLEYQIRTFGSGVTGADAGLPYNVTLTLWTDVVGDPSIGQPDTMIAGTQCDYIGVPLGSTTLVCTVPAGISIPDGLWIGVEFNQDNCGWRIANGALYCPVTGPPGFSENFWAEEDLAAPGIFAFYQFGACPTATHGSYQSAQIVVEGSPWACCDMTTFDCTNIQESACTGVFTEGTLCNNLPSLCSAAGACCDTSTGTCRDTFENLCDGYLEVFTAGATCLTVNCPVPPNVPTLTQWGMVTLTVLLLSGLTIKFGRRRTVTA